VPKIYLAVFFNFRARRNFKFRNWNHHWIFLEL